MRRRRTRFGRYAHLHNRGVSLATIPRKLRAAVAPSNPPPQARSDGNRDGSAKGVGQPNRAQGRTRHRRRATRTRRIGARAARAQVDGRGIPHQRRIRPSRGGARRAVATAFPVARRHRAGDLGSIQTRRSPHRRRACKSRGAEPRRPFSFRVGEVAFHRLIGTVEEGAEHSLHGGWLQARADRHPWQCLRISGRCVKAIIRHGPGSLRSPPPDRATPAHRPQQGLSAEGGRADGADRPNDARLRSVRTMICRSDVIDTSQIGLSRVAAFALLIEARTRCPRAWPMRGFASASRRP